MSAALAFMAPAAMPQLPPIDAGGELLRVVLSLLGIIVLIVAAGWLSRRLQARQLIGGRRLRCLETMAVGSRERIVLLEADGKRLLVGVGAGGVRTLHIYDGATPLSETSPPTVAPNFAELLGRWKRK